MQSLFRQQSRFGIWLEVYRIDRNGAHTKGERWARLRAFRNACWIQLDLPPLNRTPFSKWLMPRWARERRRELEA